MPLYYFQISHGRFSGVADRGIDLPDRDAAWVEMTKVCGDLAGTISRKLKQNAEWRMELLDEAKEPVFRVRIVAETLASSHRDGTLALSRGPDMTEWVPSPPRASASIGD